MNQEESIRFATKYLEDLISFFGINVAISSTHEEDLIKLSIPSTPLNSLLIGRNANNLRAFQQIVSATLAERNAELTRVSIDVADYKRHQAERIEEQALEWIRRVRATGTPLRLNLNAVDRRTVHKFAEDFSDITTYSEGEGHSRQLIIAQKPTSD